MGSPWSPSFADGELAESMKLDITWLIYRKRGDIKDLKNWRQIFLLNIDYKICLKAITLLVAKVLDSIIDPDQTCSVPGRSISITWFYCMVPLSILLKCTRLEF